jgi:cytoskeletal protein CcmA (bactofilin family)
MMKSFLGSSSSKGTAVDTLIGRQTEILGDVRFAGGLHVDGRIKGSVTTLSGETDAMLSVSETGFIEGNVRVPNIRLNGAVNGDVTATEKLVLASQARVTGNVHYRVLQMESGATINGQLIHDDQPVAALTHQGTLEPHGEPVVPGSTGGRRSTSY